MRQRPERGAIDSYNRHPLFSRLPPDPDNRNGIRAEWAQHAVLAFTEATGQDEVDDGLEEIVSDLLVNLGHFADRKSLNLSRLINNASGMYLEETDGIGTQFTNVSKAKL